MFNNSNSSYVANLLVPPGESDNKYTRGVLGFVTGSETYPGAALLGINAGYEVEVGMVCYWGPEKVSDLVLSVRPEVVLGIEKAMALVLGSGVAAIEAQQLERVLLASQVPLPKVVDAEALNAVDFDSLKGPVVITPHTGEAVKLFRRMGKQRDRAEIESKMAVSAQELADLTGAVVVLKGSITAVASAGSKAQEVGPNSHHLATAGTGDLLAGVIGGLIAKAVGQGLPLPDSFLSEISVVAIQLISWAAEKASSEGRYGATPICSHISDALSFYAEDPGHRLVT